MAGLRQTSFAAGELSPTLYGRTDLEAYHHGLRRCFNFTIGQHGEARSRPGSRYCVPASTSGGTTGTVRLFPFVSTDSEAYLLEFSTNQIRVLYKGALLSVTPANPIVAPWSGAGDVSQIDNLKFAQTGDILTIASDSFAPRELTRTSHLVWTLSIVDFDVPGYRDTFPNYPFILTGYPDTAGTKRDWRYRVTRVLEYEDGTVTETLPWAVQLECSDLTTVPPVPGASFPAASGTCSPAAATPITIRVDSSQAIYDTYAVGVRQIATRIYRGRSGVFGLIGQIDGPQVPGDGAKFLDYGDEPDYAQAPPEGTNPFDVPAPPAAVARVEDPAACGIFEQRMVFGGTVERPGRLWLSAVNDYLNFDDRLVLTADGPIEIELASRRREQIRWVLGLDRLLVGTDQSIWAVGGAGGAPVDPTGLNSAVVQSEIGTSWRDPIVIGDSLLYVRSKGKGVRSLAYSNERGAFTGGDVSFFAQHLFKTYGIADWTFAEDPHGLVWAALDDGTMLSLTYSREREMQAWAQHATARTGQDSAAGTEGTVGYVESVCAIPRWDAPECDEVYLVVRRTLDGVDVRYIERLASEPPPSVGYACCLDSSVTYHATGTTYDTANWDGAGTNVTAGTTVLSGLDHLLGEEVWAVVDGAVSGPHTVSNSGSLAVPIASIVIDIPAGVVGIAHVGLRFSCELELMDAAESRENKKAVKFVTWEIEASRGLWTGESFDSLTEWQQRAVSDGYDALALYTGRAKVRIGATWNTHGRAALRQVDPLPLLVVGVTREGEGGGK